MPASLHKVSKLQRKFENYLKKKVQNWKIVRCRKFSEDSNKHYKMQELDNCAQFLLTANIMVAQ